jgi:Protein of unknown function (DUF3631)
MKTRGDDLEKEIQENMEKLTTKGETEVTKGEDTATRPIIFRLTPEQFREAMERGFIGEEPREEQENGSMAKEPDEGATAMPEGKRKRDGRTIIDTVANFVRRFVFLRDKTYYTLVAAWILASHLHKKFEYLGYLFAYSPERQSGKTTLLELLNLLVCESTGLQISPTEAVMFRTAEGHTHLLDEVDSWKNKDDLKDVLNAGFKKGGVVTRCDKSKAGFKPTAYPVFAPRALAGIGVSILPLTTLDRTFALAMVRQKKDEKRERFRERKMGAEATRLKQQIENWTKENQKAVVEVYDRAEFPYLESFSDRTIDIAEPLAAIVEVACQGHPEKDRILTDLVRAVASSRKEQQSASRHHLLLKHLLHLAEAEDPLIGNATELAAQCANLEEPVDHYTVSAVLRNYGFKTKSIRKDGENPLQRYSLGRSELQELVERWVPESEGGSSQCTEDARIVT